MYKVGFYGGKFMPFHKGHLHCAQFALGECEQVYVVLFYNTLEEQRILMDEDLCRFDKTMLDWRLRLLVIQRELAAFPNVKVLAIDGKKAHAYALEQGIDEWEAEAHCVVEAIGKFDACYSSRPDMDPLYRLAYPWAEHRIIDRDRSIMNIRGTQIRSEATMDSYYLLPRTYQHLLNKSVLITGTESCGKTTLARKLAKFYSTSYTDEYGRIVCEEYGTGQPDISIYPEFIYGQKMLEVKARKEANKVFFCDTDAIVTNFYARLYEDTNIELAEYIGKFSRFDLTLYLEPRGEWVSDGLRLHGDPETRKKNDDMLKAMMAECGATNYHILRGTHNENYLHAIRLVEEMLRA